MSAAGCVEPTSQQSRAWRKTKVFHKGKLLTSWEKSIASFMICPLAVSSLARTVYTGALMVSEAQRRNSEQIRAM